MIFELNKSQILKLNKWKNKIPNPKEYCGAIEGRFVYSFIPTNLGVVCKVIDEISKKEIDLTEYENW